MRVVLEVEAAVRLMRAATRENALRKTCSAWGQTCRGCDGMAEDGGGGGGHGGLCGASEHKLLAVAVGFGEATRAVDDDALCFVHVDVVTDFFVADKIGVADNQ